MTDPHIAQRRPYVLEEQPGVKFWCACGQSQRQPYCDGSHKGTTFAPVKVEIAEARRVAWCGCKHTATKPFCDGTHGRLTE